MTLLSHAPPAAASNNGSAPHGPTKRRRPPPAVIGLVVAVVSLAIFVVLTPRQVQASSVLVLARAVPAGATISATDLKTLSMGVPRGLAVEPVSNEDTVVGQVAQANLAAGSLLAPSELAPPSGALAEVGVALKPGQYPPGLAAGDRVEVLEVQSGGGVGQSTPSAAPVVLAPVALVESAAPSAGDANTVLVGLGVAAGEAVNVAQAGAAGEVVLVVER